MVVHGGDGIEWGGWGTDAVVLTTNDHSTVCHEFGHVLGFDHSRGFLGEGGIFDDDYGSRYDVMAVPNDFMLSDPLDYFPFGGGNAGPMVARAHIFYKKPDLMREAGKVLEADLHTEPTTLQVWAAGRGGPPGQAELLALHLNGNRTDPHHLLMVEYRQPDPNPTPTTRPGGTEVWTTRWAATHQV